MGTSSLLVKYFSLVPHAELKENIGHENNLKEKIKH